MSDDPWQDIAPPSTLDAISAKRVDPDVCWDFFWGRAPDRRCVFVLSHSPECAPHGRLPNLRGVEISDVPRGANTNHVLMFKLLDDGQRDIFQRLCRDIVASASRAASEAEAVNLALARTFRWHHLLRGGPDGRLSPEEQKGLAAELLVIEEHLLRCLSPRDALDCWRGPTGSPKDFEIGRLCIEAKARRGASRPHIAISSADQLDTTGIDELLLFVVEIDQAPEDASAGFTMAELVTRVRDRLMALDASVSETFEERLLAAGFDPSDNYGDMRWVAGKALFFRVSEGFPRISASTLPSGIGNVTYTVALQDCVPYALGGDPIVDAVNARRDVR